MHLPDQVERFGPLNKVSCFAFKGLCNETKRWLLKINSINVNSPGLIMNNSKMVDINEILIYEKSMILQHFNIKLNSIETCSSVIIDNVD